MKPELQNAEFDYGNLSAEDGALIRAATERIKLRLKRSAEDVIDIGDDLNEVKKTLKHGQFGKWLGAEFDMSEDTAQNFMRVAKRFGKNRRIRDLPPTALYELAAPSTPEEVVAKVEESLERGEKVTAANIKDLKSELRAAERDKRQAEQARDNAEKNLHVSESKREELQRKVSDLNDEVIRLSDEQIITMRAASPDYSDAWRLLLSVWAAVPQPVRDRFFKEVGYPDVVLPIPQPKAANGTAEPIEDSESHGETQFPEQEIVEPEENPIPGRMPRPRPTPPEWDDLELPPILKRK